MDCRCFLTAPADSEFRRWRSTAVAAWERNRSDSYGSSMCSTLLFHESCCQWLLFKRAQFPQLVRFLSFRSQELPPIVHAGISLFFTSGFCQLSMTCWWYCILYTPMPMLMTEWKIPTVRNKQRNEHTFFFFQHIPFFLNQSSSWNLIFSLIFLHQDWTFRSHIPQPAHRHDDECVTDTTKCVKKCRPAVAMMTSWWFQLGSVTVFLFFSFFASQ